MPEYTFTTLIWKREEVRIRLRWRDRAGHMRSQEVKACVIRETPKEHVVRGNTVMQTIRLGGLSGTRIESFTVR